MYLRPERVPDKQLLSLLGNRPRGTAALPKYENERARFCREAISCPHYHGQTKASNRGRGWKIATGPFLPEAFWYSKVLCILALEATNEKIGPITTLNTTEEESDATLHSPINVTNSSSNPFSQSDLSEGEVGRRELGDGSKRGSTDFAIRDEHHHNAPPLAGEGEAISSPAPSPRDCVIPQSREYHGDVQRQKEILWARGFLP
jgi:hypothetical protein